MIFLIALILAVIAGFFGAWGGAKGTSKGWRRILVPAIATIFSILVLRSFWMIFNMARAGALSLGYGIPCFDDEGSDLGKFWFEVLGKDGFKANIATRATIGFVGSLTLLAIPIVAGHFYLFIIASILIIANNIYWGALKLEEGTFEVFGKQLLWEEAYIHGIDTLIILILVMLCR